MKLPRNMDAPELIKKLERLGYFVVRQTGSHVRLRCEQPSSHALTIPNHAPIKLGLLAAILLDVATTRHVSKDEVIRLLWDEKRLAHSRPRRANLLGSDTPLPARPRDLPMSQQFGLFGSAPPVPTDRLFFGLFPDPAVAARISVLGEDVCRRHDLLVPRHQTERLHLTLFHIGDWVGLPSEVVETAKAAAVGLRMDPFDVRFDQVASFSGNRARMPLVLKAGEGNEALHNFRTSLGRELFRVGLGRCVTRSFEPHITLAYAPRAIMAEPVEPIVWTATKFVLIHSQLGKTRHIPLGGWPLAAA